MSCNVAQRATFNATFRGGNMVQVFEIQKPTTLLSELRMLR